MNIQSAICLHGWFVYPCVNYLVYDRLSMTGQHFSFDELSHSSTNYTYCMQKEDRDDASQ